MSVHRLYSTIHSHAKIRFFLMAEMYHTCMFYFILDTNSKIRFIYQITSKSLSDSLSLKIESWLVEVLAYFLLFMPIFLTIAILRTIYSLSIDFERMNTTSWKSWYFVIQLYFVVSHRQNSSREPSIARPISRSSMS